jgi:hypothetical protein
VKSSRWEIVGVAGGRSNRGRLPPKAPDAAGSENGDPGERKSVMNAYKSIAWTGAVALLAAGFLGAPRAAKADDANSMQTIKLLADAKAMAVQAKDDAATLRAFDTLDFEWEAHGGAVAKMGEHVMAMDEEVASLQALKGTAEPWAKAVIDRIAPFMTALAADNEAAMDEFSAHPSLFGTEASRAFLDANADAAAHLSALILNFVENGTLRQVIQDDDEQEDTCGLIGVAHLTFGLES